MPLVLAKARGPSGPGIQSVSHRYILMELVHCGGEMTTPPKRKKYRYFSKPQGNLGPAIYNLAAKKFTLTLPLPLVRKSSSGTHTRLSYLS